MKNKYCVLFAGPIGCSKSPIANYLSYNFDLPIFNNDSIRTEVAEDLGDYSNDEYLKRRDTRLKELLESGISFIYDASIDRDWERLKTWLDSKNYNHFIISINLSKEFLSKLYGIKGYTESLDIMEKNLNDHNNFLKQYKHLVNLSINEDIFKERLNISNKKLAEWLSE